MKNTLSDSETEIEIGRQVGIFITKIENAKNLLDILDDETIAIKIGLDLETVKILRLLKTRKQ